MEEGENLSFEELDNSKEETVEFDSEASSVNEGYCPDCHEKLIKVVENRSVLNGALTFHIIKLRCQKCGREFLDLDQAEKYDFALLFEKIEKEPIDVISRRILNQKLQ